MTESIKPADGEPAYRYTAALAGEIESRWQAYWEEHHTFEAPNPAGPLKTDGPVPGAKGFIMDMFPYPSGTGLHVGHPLGFIATDVYARYQRMLGRNVLHAMGFDAFGLPAEQHAVETGTHPRVTTEQNIARYRAQIRRIGLAHDKRRGVSTTDVEFYRWTQWIFLQIFNSWYDEEARRARPVAELVALYESGARPTPDGRPWAELDAGERADAVDAHRLTYIAEAPVNWCPALGTVLANEEVTADGRSERGNYPVFKRNLRQWMMRITAYGDRLLDDLDRLDWPEPIKLMQRNWIGRSEGARVRFPIDPASIVDARSTGTASAAAASAAAPSIEVFTTRPDTLFGATYMVLAPEHPLVDQIVPAAWPQGTKDAWTGGAATPAAAVDAYKAQAAAKTEVERQTEGRLKTGVFTGAYAVNPVNGEQVPVFVADYVLWGYGTGAIMAVPAHDHRDFEFARAFELPMRIVVQPPKGAPEAVEDWEEAFDSYDATVVNSANGEVSLDGMAVPEAKKRIIAWLEEKGRGTGTVTYRLRDWLFSRQRYWGEPFPIVYEADDPARRPIALPESMLPLELPEIVDYAPRVGDPNDATAEPAPPLARATEWVDVELDLGRGEGVKRYRRETNSMPQWAGSCWYYLRYLDPTNQERFCDPEVERYWIGPRDADDVGGVDLYVGGAEHAVLHLLYSRFWHKVLFDLGFVSSAEPFRRLINQGYIQAYAYTDERGVYVPADQVEEVDGVYYYQGSKVNREYGKMGKSLKNSVSPDEFCDTYGADTLRVYEMSMGPLEVSRPWETKAVAGSYRFLQRVWRNVVDEETGRLTVVDEAPDEDTQRALHTAIAGVREDLGTLRFNTAVAKLIVLNNHLTKLKAVPKSVAEDLAVMIAPLAPHLAEELWERLGHDGTIAFEPFPVADPRYLVVDEVTCIVQVAGKLRDKLQVPPDITEDALRTLALDSDGVRRALDGRAVRTVIVRAPKLVNVVPV